MQCTILLFCLCFINILSQYQIERRDPLAELSSSLHTKQSGACDGESLEMKCPAATKISIQLVQYGRLTPHDGLCPANIRYPGPRPSITGGEETHQQEKCLILEAIRTVEERCHSKESCSVATSPESLARGLRDPCPTVRKYVEVLYKCKPASFRSRVVCGNELVSLSCQDHNDRLAIFSSVFSTGGGSHVFCPGRARVVPGSRVMCEDQAVTERVSSLCHGYSACRFRAEPLSLGQPGSACSADKHRLTLKLTFACVDKSVFHSDYVDRKTTSTTTTTTTITTTITTTRATTTTLPSAKPKLVPSTITVKPVISSNVKSQNDILNSQESKKLVVLDSKSSSGTGNVPSILETNSNFEQEHKYKLLMFSALVASICLVSSLIFISIKIYQSYWSTTRRRSSRVNLDLDTVSSESLSGDFMLQETETTSSSCQTLASAKTEFKPRGILKNSRTSENFRLYNNPVDDTALVKTGTLGRDFPLSHDSPRKTLMNSQFLHHDIEDQLKNLPDRGVAMAVLDSQKNENQQVTSNITSELIETLLKLRSALPASQERVGSNINSCLDDCRSSVHNNQVTNSTSSPPFVIQSLDEAGLEEAEKLFVL